MRLSILAALVVCLAAAGLAPGQCWGPRCAPAVAGPGFPVPDAPAAFPVSLAPLPVFVAGPGGVCSARCSCGCNEGQQCECPHAKEARAAAPPAKRDDLPTGVDGSKLSERPRYTVNGVEMPRDELIRTLTGQLKDDSAKKSLTLIGGADSERKAMRSALEGLDWLRERVHYQDYPQGDPMVARHDCDGLTLYLQERPSGKKLLHVKRISPANTGGIIDRLKQALGLGPPPPAPPSPPLVGPDGTPLPPAPPQEGYSTQAVAGTGILGMLLLAGLQWGWQRLKQQQGQQPAPAAPQVPALPPAPPSGPMLPPAPPVQPGPADLADLVQQAAMRLWEQRMAGTPLEMRVEYALGLLRQVIHPPPAPVPQEQPKP